ncbi:acetylornithine deacetylase [Pelagibius sp.]|uniref:acetylornithine deacetylase n=1 Tax=Pelagibius sp. TaxID=1931238 RepID=UPI002631CB9D|nr:acetylornithine deacetylase [Pelagibius sp.]
MPADVNAPADPHAGEPAIRPETRAMIERLIAFDTTSRNSNLDLIHDVRDYLAGLGVRASLVHDPEGRKANLYATLGPEDRGGIALSGHTDVVPIDDQDWSVDPWQVSEAGGRLYGRGTTDMKSFLAVALAYAPRFLAGEMKTPIHLCLSYDEEVGCRGVPALISFLAEQPVRPKLCIVGEPTEMKVVTAHKGKLSIACQVRGKEAHSSLAPHGVNAVQAAARVIARLTEMAEEKAQEGPFDSDYDVPYTTIHTGVIHGGTQLNIVPGHCRFEFEFRHLPEDSPQALLAAVKRYAAEELAPAMQAVDPGSGFAWEEVSSFPGLNLAPDAEVVDLAKALSGGNATGKVAFGTEAGLFDAGGIPAVVCGPGSIDQAHKPDEFVTLEQIALCERFMERLEARVRQGEPADA